MLQDVGERREEGAVYFARESVHSTRVDRRSVVLTYFPRIK